MVRVLQLIVLIVLTIALAAAGYHFTNGFGLQREGQDRYILHDIYSLVTIPDDAGGCQAAVGYREKHVIGSFVVQPVKRMVCTEYYFRENPSSKNLDAPIVLVRLETGEYHWVLESQLVAPLQN